MTDFITLTCPSCNGKLEIRDGLNRFACAHCGTEHIVNRGGGTISLDPVVEGLKHVRDDTNVLRSEMAIARLEKDMKDIEKQIQRARKARTADRDPQAPLSAAFFGGLIAYGISNNFGTAMVVAILGFILAIVIPSIIDAKGEEKLQPLKDKISRKKNELARHRRIVSG